MDKNEGEGHGDASPARSFVRSPVLFVDAGENRNDGVADGTSEGAEDGKRTSSDLVDDAKADETSCRMLKTPERISTISEVWPIDSNNVGA